jgi:hypothetical protein
MPSYAEKLKKRRLLLNILVPIIGIISISIAILAGSSLLDLLQRLQPVSYEEDLLKRAGCEISRILSAHMGACRMGYYAELTEIRGRLTPL